MREAVLYLIHKEEVINLTEERAETMSRTFLTIVTILAVISFILIAYAILLIGTTVACEVLPYSQELESFLSTICFGLL